MTSGSPGLRKRAHYHLCHRIQAPNATLDDTRWTTRPPTPATAYFIGVTGTLPSVPQRWPHARPPAARAVRSPVARCASHKLPFSSCSISAPSRPVASRSIVTSVRCRYFHQDVVTRSRWGVVPAWDLVTLCHSHLIHSPLDPRLPGSPRSRLLSSTASRRHLLISSPAVPRP